MEWKNSKWKFIEFYIFKLQKKIYYHARKNEIGLIRHYQHKHVKSMEARLSIGQTGKLR